MILDELLSIVESNENLELWVTTNDKVWCADDEKCITSLPVRNYFTRKLSDEYGNCKVMGIMITGNGSLRVTVYKEEKKK